MKLSNKTKDVILIIGILFVMFWVMIGAICWVASVVFAEETEQAQINRYYTEESIKIEMRYLAMWQYTENMTEEEYNKTFMEE